MQAINAVSALKNTGDIIKARWSEVTLIAAIQVGLMLLFERLVIISAADPSQTGTIPGGAQFVLGFGSMLMAIVWQMLYLGFLRTAALNGTAPHEPMTLLLTGRPFFWRFLGVQVVLGVALWLVAGLLAGLAGSLLGYSEASAFPQWLLELSGVAAIALFIKPFFLIPAFMLALDMPAMVALGMLRQCRLGELGVLLKAYALGLTAIAVAAVSVTLATRGTLVYHVVAGASYLTQSLMVLILMLATTLFLVPKAAEETEDQE